MALFDQLVVGRRRAKVVDLGHGLFERFFAVMQQIDFAAEARRRSVVPMVLFIADPDDRARQGYAMLQHRFADLRWCRCSTRRCRWSRAIATISRRRGAAAPAGDPGAVAGRDGRWSSGRGFSFCAYAAKTTDTTTELYSWMRRVFLSSAS